MLGKAVVKAINKAISDVFDKAKSRFLNRPVPHQVRISAKTAGHIPEATLPGMYLSASIEERNKPNQETLDYLTRTAESYFDAHLAHTQARTVQAIESFLKDAKTKGVDTNVETVMGGKLSELFGVVKRDLNKIVETETNVAKNVGVLEGIVKVNASAGINDPVVYFSGPNCSDTETCSECCRLFFMPDGVTPRCWYMSEVGNGYHKKGESEPKIGGLHPSCRHTLSGLMPGYGFKNGVLQFISNGYSEIVEQRK